MVVGVGGDCQYGTTVCQSGLSCQGICERPGPVGTGCSTDTDCDDGLTCPLAGMLTCVQRATLGQSCDQLSCEFGQGCAWSIDGGTSCQPLIAGGSCVDDLDGGLCLEAQQCVDGGCVPLGIAGDPCGQDSDCFIGRCVSGSCALVGAGSPCGGNQDCTSNRCDASGSAPVCAANCVH